MNLNDPITDTVIEEATQECLKLAEHLNTVASEASEYIRDMALAVQRAARVLALTIEKHGGQIELHEDDMKVPFTADSSFDSDTRMYTFTARRLPVDGAN